jgi:hypothetical protein
MLKMNGSKSCSGDYRRGKVYFVFEIEHETVHYRTVRCILCLR